MLAFVLTLSLVSEAPESTVAAAVAQGDAHYARRAEGARGAVASPAVIDKAILAYRRAVAADPTSVVVRARLLKALFFRAVFCGAGHEERQRLLDEGRRLGDEAIARLEQAARPEPGRLARAAAVGSPPRPELLVEDTQYAGLAKERLANP